MKKELTEKQYLSKQDIIDILCVALGFVETPACVGVKLMTKEYKRSEAADLLRKLIHQTKYDKPEQKD